MNHAHEQTVFSSHSLDRRRVSYAVWINETKSYFHGDGVFLGFGIDYEELENGIGTFTSAIIERNDGKVLSVFLENIRFLDKGEKCHVG